MLDSKASSGGGGHKRKRRPAGTPDPDAEVVSLSPRTLLESDRYVCEICGQGFQREQNLQMHRRRHRVPWKLMKKSKDGGDDASGKKRVFVCPEPGCLHHQAGHALGDMVGIKKHYRRKHSAHRQWVCHRCTKGYAVQSDYKAHLKTCGTRGHSCDCGRVFSRVDTFIQHQDACVLLSPPDLQSLIPPPPGSNGPSLPTFPNHRHELQLLPSSSFHYSSAAEVREAMRRQVEMAEVEFETARWLRRQAKEELERAWVLKEQAARKLGATLLQITCHACRQSFAAATAEVEATEGDGDGDGGHYCR